MKNKKMLWTGILIGFLFAVLMFGVVFIVWKLVDRKTDAQEDQNSPIQTEESTPTPDPADTAPGELLWEGTWERTGDTVFEGAVLELVPAQNGIIEFSITANNGGNIGEVSGKAAVEGNYAAYSDQEAGYQISLMYNGDTITVTMSGKTEGVLGNGVTIDGEYRLGKQEKRSFTLTELGVFSEAEQEETFKEYLGEDYELFTDYFQLVSVAEDLDGVRAKVSIGGIRGLFSINEGIIMAVPDGTFWAAVIDGTSVKFYTNTEDTGILPVTIDRWRQRFPELEVVNGKSGSVMRVLTVKDLKNRGFTVMKEHTFPLEIKELGPVQFLGGTVIRDGALQPEYYLVNDKEEIIYKIPAVPEVGSYSKTRAISFQDISSGTIYYGKKTQIQDIVIMEEYTDPQSEYGDIPIAHVRIYTWNGEDFNDRKELYEELNSENKNDNILVIMENILDSISRKQELASEDITIYETFSQKVLLENWGEVDFVAAGRGEAGKKSLSLYLTREKTEVIYRFYMNRKDYLQEIKEISFTDADQNGTRDLAVLADYLDATGQIYRAFDLYLQFGDEFIPVPSIAQKVNQSGKNESLRIALEFLKDEAVILNLMDLKTYGWTAFPERTVSADLPGWGKCKLTAGTRKDLGVNVLSLSLTDSTGNILYRLPKLNDRDCHSISEISLQDINQDGLLDILLILNFTTGPGTDGITPAPFCAIYLQGTDHTFVNIPELDREINYRYNGKTIKDVLKSIVEMIPKEAEIP